MMAATLLYVSCGLIDMELGEGTQYAYDMTLEYDSIYVRIGDSVLIKPVFVPDSVSNSEVLYLSEDENVATIVNDTVVAMASGEVLVTAMSVLGGIADTCKVYVMEPWVLNPMDFANDMVVYATATVDGKPFDPETMDIAAFAGPEFRGMGELKEINGIRFLQFCYEYLITIRVRWHISTTLFFHCRKLILWNQNPIWYSETRCRL